jgi:hypothetical protein
VFRRAQLRSAVVDVNEKVAGLYEHRQDEYQIVAVGDPGDRPRSRELALRLQHFEIVRNEYATTFRLEAGAQSCFHPSDSGETCASLICEVQREEVSQ